MTIACARAMQLRIPPPPDDLYAVPAAAAAAAAAAELYTGSTDRTVAVWDPATGARLRVPAAAIVVVTLAVGPRRCWCRLVVMSDCIIIALLLYYYCIIIVLLLPSSLWVLSHCDVLLY